FVCAFTKACNTPAVLRSYDTEDAVDSLSTSNCKIWEAARATSAAATFFNPITVGFQEYVDGGTGHNNPVEIVLEEAKSIWKDAATRIQCLVSIGTGVPDPKDFGDNLKEVVETLKAISTQTEATEMRFCKNAKSLGVGGRYFRFNVTRGLGDIGVDEHDQKSLSGIAVASERYLKEPMVGERVQKFLCARSEQHGT
ncbi:calcium-independent phospholipase, partial [Dichotomopilus funicola]